jgi:predicted DNA-binding transcriptional regulator AlpA
MKTLLTTEPTTRVEFNRLCREAIDYLLPLMEKRTFLRECAELISRVKYAAIRLGLNGIANRLPEDLEKTPAKAILRLRECLEPPPAEPPALLSADQVATMLGVSVRTVWRLQSTGDIPEPIQLGGLTKWRRLDIEHHIGV